MTPVSAYAFAVSFLMPVLIVVAAFEGGYWLLAVPFYAWFASSILDRILGPELRNADTGLPDSALFWHRFVTWAWIPTQSAMILFAIWAATHLTAASDSRSKTTCYTYSVDDESGL